MFLLVPVMCKPCFCLSNKGNWMFDARDTKSHGVEVRTKKTVKHDKY